VSRALLLRSRRGCVLSDCELYRYDLWAIWDESKPLVAFCLLNPSTATDLKPDPTWAKCASFAELWGYGGLHLVNPYSFRSTDPDGLLTTADPIGIDTKFHIFRVSRACQEVVCGWGANINRAVPGREVQVLQLIQRAGREPLGFKLTKDGHPYHPLYIPFMLRPQPLRNLSPEKFGCF
jgi:hypothetical protein